MKKAANELAAFSDVFTRFERESAIAPDSSTRVLLKHVLLALTIGLESRARRFDRRIEVLDGMPAFLADAIAELEALYLSDRPNVDSTVVGAAARSTRWRDDSTGILILGRLRVRVLDNVLDQSMRPLFGILLSDVATDSSQWLFLTSFRSPLGCSTSRQAPEAGTIDFQRAAHTAVPPWSRVDSH